MYPMFRSRFLRLVAAFLVMGASACKDDNDDYVVAPEPLPASTVVSGSGDITTKIAEFRGLLGEPNNGATKGQQIGGRREVNWDGVPAAVTNTNTFPVDFFNVNSSRGIVLSTPGTGLRVSDNDFNDLNALYDAAFEDLSPAKTFMSIGSDVTEMTFRVAGDTTKALVKGFGVVFSDVDAANSTFLEFFDATGRKIATVKAPVRSDAKGHSFAGATFASAIVARVRVVSGQGTLGANTKDITDGGTLDLVVMDDFIYGEPIKPAAQLK